MRAQISRWGNSLALRIPGHIAREMDVSEGKSVEMSVDSGRLVIEPVSGETSYRLDELLAQVNEDNRHEEIETGEAVGNELA